MSIPIQSPPLLNIPSSLSTVSISILNTTSRIDRLSTSYHYPPNQITPKFTHLNCPCLAFLIEHPPTGKKVLFDLGMRKDWQNLAPSIVGMIKAVGAKITTEKGVDEILEDGGIRLEEIDGIVWSHHHCDHTGDPSLFPPSTKLYVGPGFRKAFMPGYPANPDAAILESDYNAREVQEISFPPSNPTIGGFRAHDFFGDGSFYLLDAPGHSEAHLMGLARTSAAEESEGEGREATFILMGADCAHHGGEIRPSPYCPLPQTLDLSKNPNIPTSNDTCPGTLFAAMHRLAPSPATHIEPFLICKDEVTHDVGNTKRTIEGVQAFDACEDVLVVMAHDQSLMGVVGFWPETANGWKGRGWKGEGMWKFLGELGCEREGWVMLRG